jgi:hypothetical protein
MAGAATATIARPARPARLAIAMTVRVVAITIAPRNDRAR